MEVLNIITRTHRQQYFEVCKQSVETQTYKNINWIVGSDADCHYYPAIKLFKDYRKPALILSGHYFAPYNLHLNTLALEVKEGYVMYLDDDDRFTDENSVQRIMNEVQEDTMLVWKVKITDKFIVPSHSFGDRITAGDFSGIGFCVHSKHLPVDWGRVSYGDYRVAMQLLEKGLKIKWINEILTQTQNGANHGR